MTGPRFGALPEGDGVRFRLLAGGGPPPQVQLSIETGRAAGRYDLQPAGEGVLERVVAGAAAGDRYAYLLGGQDLRPDPASRFQPEGVHGVSEVVDPRVYRWRDDGWRGLDARALVLYELHVGTFTTEGTFAAAAGRLPELRDLGITAVEIMPVADFPGSRNWGYDGVSLFAPARAYGRPDDLRAFVDAAHGHGLAVLLDVVYNHLGPEGAYLSQFYPRYFTDRHATPWGSSINLDDEGSAPVRQFIIDNARHWVGEYHLDGLRLDATHALFDDSPVPLLAELGEEVRRAARWPLHVHAEDHRNLAAIVEPRAKGGWGLDGLWADDFHHSVRRLTAGDSHGYYQDFEGTPAELARTIRQGWLFTGQPSKHMQHPRGTDASGVPMRCSVVCVQNHDQVGNRAHGERLHHQIDPAAWRAASVVLLTAPMTPLLFMGQEWAATTPFQYFTDVEPELGRLVTEGRRREFKDFPGFDPRHPVPDPQDEATYRASQLKWEERGAAPHAHVLALYTRLLALRAAHPCLQGSEQTTAEAWPAGKHGLIVRRADGGDVFLVVASLPEGGEVPFADRVPAGARPDVVLTTEDAPFAADPAPPAVGPTSITFHRAGAVVLRLR